MKIFILCGGYGSRLDHEGKLIAKPMVRIGRNPILMHLIDNYTDQGFNEFVFCLGHKSRTIIDYFLKEKKNNIKILIRRKNYIKFKFKDIKKKFLGNLIYTGLNSGTGGRIKIAYNKLKLQEDIMMTYGDGLANININKLINFHYKNKSEITLTAVRPKQRYGVLKLNKNKVKFFDNNKQKSDVYINGGFFVINKKSIKKIKHVKMYWEKEPLEYYIKAKKLFAFKHNGFWKSLDTQKDKKDFNELYKKNRNKLPWKV
jgi:glucose-1-phosphate cytidylyltransferase